MTDVRAESAAAQRPEDPADARVWDTAATVCDPEVPVLTIEDLGILRSARATDSGAVVEITPTYSGCPAVGRMRDDVSEALEAQGYGDVRVLVVLCPAWSTDWMTDEGKRKLADYGIAPPEPSGEVHCPQCGSANAEEVSRFGSTPCKSQWRCRDCLEPFDRFKCH